MLQANIPKSLKVRQFVVSPLFILLACNGIEMPRFDRFFSAILAAPIYDSLTFRDDSESGTPRDTVGHHGRN